MLKSFGSRLRSDSLLITLIVTTVLSFISSCEEKNYEREKELLLFYDTFIYPSIPDSITDFYHLSVVELSLCGLAGKCFSLSEQLSWLQKQDNNLPIIMTHPVGFLGNLEYSILKQQFSTVIFIPLEYESLERYGIYKSPHLFTIESRKLKSYKNLLQ